MTAKQKLFDKIDVLVGGARQTYYVEPLSGYMTGRGKTASASLASSPGVQLGQSMWMSSMLKKMTGGGGTTGKSALWAALVGAGPIPADWTEASRMTILLDMLLFRSFPSAVSFVAHMGLSALTDTMLKAEAKKRWDNKVAIAFVAWHKATVTFLSAISELDESSPAKRKKASTLPNLSDLTDYSKARAKKSKRTAPSAKAAERAKEIAQGKALRVAVDNVEFERHATEVRAALENMDPVK